MYSRTVPVPVPVLARYFYFVYSSCTPSMPLLSFISSNFHTLSSFPLLLQQLPHLATMFPYVCMDGLTYVLCCFHHIFCHITKCVKMSHHKEQSLTSDMLFI